MALDKHTDSRLPRGYWLMYVPEIDLWSVWQDHAEGQQPTMVYGSATSDREQTVQRALRLLTCTVATDPASSASERREP